jgi:hypothetical protein
MSDTECQPMAAPPVAGRALVRQRHGVLPALQGLHLALLTAVREGADPHVELAAGAGELGHVLAGAARAGNSRFWPLSALCAHTNAPYKIDSL